MIDKYFFKYSTYTKYLADKSNIPEESFCFISSPKMAIINGVELRCIGTMSVSEIQNYSFNSLNAKNTVGVFLIENSVSYNNDTMAGICFVFSDYQNHTLEQVIVSNLIINTSGKIDGSHSDGNINILHRTYNYQGNISGVSQGSWSAWKAVSFTDVVETIDKSAAIGYKVTKTTTTSYLSLSSSHVSGEKEPVINLTYNGSGGNRFGINILSSFLTALKTKAVNNGGYAKCTINVINTTGGAYIGCKVGSAYFDGSSYWGGKDTKTYNGVNICTNIPCYSVYDSTKEKEAGSQGIIEISYFISSTSVDYLNVIYK